MAVLNRWLPRHYGSGLSPALRLTLLCGAAIALMGLAGLLTLAQSSRVTTAGYRLRQLEQSRLQQQAQVNLLEAEVAEMASLERIQREASRRLLMGPPQEVIYIRVAEPQPDIKHVPDRFFPPSPPPEVPKNPWWKTLLRLLPLP